MLFINSCHVFLYSPYNARCWAWATIFQSPFSLYKSYASQIVIDFSQSSTSNAPLLSSQKIGSLSFALLSMSSKILMEIVFVGSGTGSSVNTASFRLLARPRKSYFDCRRLIMVSTPLGLVADLSIVVISCHLGGAGLVPRRFDFLFRVWSQRLVKSFHTFQIAELTFAAFASSSDSL